MKIETEDKDFLRDTDSNALINRNNRALEEYRMKKLNQKRIEKLEEQISDINSKLNSITELLTELVNR